MRVRKSHPGFSYSTKDSCTELTHQMSFEEAWLTRQKFHLPTVNRTLHTTLLQSNWWLNLAPCVFHSRSTQNTMNSREKIRLWNLGSYFPASLPNYIGRRRSQLIKSSSWICICLSYLSRGIAKRSESKASSSVHWRTRFYCPWEQDRHPIPSYVLPRWLQAVACIVL